MKYICFSLVERICFEFSFTDIWRPSTQHTVSNENQRRLIFCFSVLNLHGVGAFVFDGKLIYHHLDKASWLVTLDSVCLGAQKEGENSTVKFLPPVFPLAPNSCINYCILRDRGAQKTHKKKFQPLNLLVNQRANEGPLGEPKIKRATFGDGALGLRGEWPTHKESSRNSAHSSGMCTWCEITQHTGERERGALGHVRSQNHRQQHNHLHSCEGFSPGDSGDTGITTGRPLLNTSTRVEGAQALHPPSGQPPMGTLSRCRPSRAHVSLGLCSHRLWWATETEVWLRMDHVLFHPWIWYLQSSRGQGGRRSTSKEWLVFDAAVIQGKDSIGAPGPGLPSGTPLPTPQEGCLLWPWPPPRYTQNEQKHDNLCWWRFLQAFLLPFRGAQLGFTQRLPSLSNELSQEGGAVGWDERVIANNLSSAAKKQEAQEQSPLLPLRTCTPSTTFTSMRLLQRTPICG